MKIDSARFVRAVHGGGDFVRDGLPQLADSWAAATDAFETDPLMTRLYPAELIRNMAMTKRQEIARFADRPEDQHWLSYLEAV